MLVVGCSGHLPGLALQAAGCLSLCRAVACQKAMEYTVNSCCAKIVRQSTGCAASLLARLEGPGILHLGS